jgi:hybrid cluster-associated redox disulfide protein
MAIKKPAKISKETPLGELVRDFPQAVPIMLEKGMHCIGCHVAAFETIEQGAKAHGMSEKEIEKLVSEMNKAVKKA